MAGSGQVVQEGDRLRRGPTDRGSASGAQPMTDVLSGAAARPWSEAGTGRVMPDKASISMLPTVRVRRIGMGLGAGGGVRGVSSTPFSSNWVMRLTSAGVMEPDLSGCIGSGGIGEEAGVRFRRLRLRRRRTRGNSACRHRLPMPGRETVCRLHDGRGASMSLVEAKCRSTVDIS